MTAALRIISAASVTLEQLAAAFNASFAGYFYPMRLTGELLSWRVRAEHLELARSLIAYEGDELVGMALLGVRHDVGWVGGFGITEPYRGQGRAQQLMSPLIEAARAGGVRLLTLEVLQQNLAAIRLYERAGMRRARELIIYERTPQAASSRTGQLKQATPGELLRHFHRLHLQPPAWQRDLASLLVLDNMRALYLGSSDLPDAYVLLRDAPNGKTHLVDLAAAREESADALCAGLAEVQGSLRVINEPESSIFCAALEAHGFVATARQLEMVMAL